MRRCGIDLHGCERPIRILFVCLGNICRSPAAEGVMQAIVDAHDDGAQWYIDSAGTGGYHVGDLPDSRMRSHGRRRGYDFRHICRQVREADFDRFDVIVPMDDDNLADLRRLAPTLDHARKIVPISHWLDGTGFDHVPDPYYQGAEGFEAVLDLLETACQRIYDSAQ